MNDHKNSIRCAEGRVGHTEESETKSEGDLRERKREREVREENALAPPHRHHLPRFLLPREDLNDLLPTHEDGCLFSARKEETEEGSEREVALEKLYCRVRVLCSCLLTLTVSLRTANDSVREDFRKKYLLPLSTAFTCKYFLIFFFFKSQDLIDGDHKFLA